MRPLPTMTPQPASAATAPKAVGRELELREPAIPNQRRNVCPTQRAYPWLLALSTVMAAIFCSLYVTKPVILQATTPPVPVAANAEFEGPAPGPAPLIAKDSLPGDSPSRPSPSAPRNVAENPMGAFEETNLRIQHVLTAAGPEDQDLGRIVLDVPVLYRSGNIRWDSKDLSRARSLLNRLDSYQAKSRALRDEAVGIITDWDTLVVHSIPERVLRADSPTLPENQGPGTAGEGPMNTTEAIEIEQP